MRVAGRALKIDYLSELKVPFPEGAAKALAVAKRFHEGIASNEERTHARQACWQELGPTRNPTTPHECIIRAVIMSLDDPQDQHRGPEGEHLEWFFYFVENFEGYQPKPFEGESPKEEAFLKRYFPLAD